MTNVQTRLKDDFSAGLDRLAGEMRTSVLFSGAAAMAGVFYEEAQVQALKHRKTGLLYSAIYRAHAEDRSTPTQVTYQISWNRRKAPHGHLLEFGTSRAPAYPFIRPAWARAADAVDAGLTRMSERFDEVMKVAP